MKKVLKQRKKTTTEENGTVIEEEISYSIKSNVQPFTMIFTSDITFIDKLASMIDMKVLYILADRSEFNTGIVVLHASDRKEIVDTLAISNQTFTNALTRLKSSGVISGSAGKYYINPRFMWKGTTNSRNAAIKELNKHLYDRPISESGNSEEIGSDEDKPGEQTGRQEVGREARKRLLHSHEQDQEGSEEI